MTEEQEDVRDALKRMWRLDVTYLGTTILPEVAEQGVFVFAIYGHLEAITVFGWSEAGIWETRYFSFLHQNA